MTEWTRPCACGSTVAADPDDPYPGVRAHVRAEPHRSWSMRPLKPTLGPLTVERLAELGLAPKVAV